MHFERERYGSTNRNRARSDVPGRVEGRRAEVRGGVAGLNDIDVRTRPIEFEICLR